MGATAVKIRPVARALLNGRTVHPGEIIEQQAV
jgi:hypothetical protein